MHGLGKVPWYGSEMEINILLGKVPAKQLGAPVDYLKVVHSAYSNQYLQAVWVLGGKVKAIREPPMCIGQAVFPVAAVF